MMTAAKKMTAKTILTAVAESATKPGFRVVAEADRVYLADPVTGFPAVTVYQWGRKLAAVGGFGDEVRAANRLVAEHNGRATGDAGAWSKPNK